MKMRKALSTILVLALLCALGLPGAFAEGKPVTQVRHISTVEDLQKLAADCTLDSFSVGLSVVLDNDLDLSGTEIHPIPTFGGSFNGGGHSISGLRLATDGSHQALFRYLQQGASLTDLNVTGTVSPENGKNQISGVVATNHGTVENVHFEGIISGKNYVGGVVGENYGTVKNCTARGKVEGKRFTGGVVGYSEGLVTSCTNYAQVNTSITEAGLELENLTLSGITQLELTNAEDENVVSDSGGVVGFSKGVLQNSVNRGTVGYPHYGYNVGGVAGRQSGYINNCTNYGEVYGRKDVAGVVGQMEPFRVLKESVNLADELLVLNYLMNRAMGSVSNMSEDMSASMVEIREGSDSAGSKLGTGGSITRVEDLESGGAAAESSGGTISGTGSSSGSITDADLQDGLNNIGDSTGLDTDNVTVPEGLSGDLSTMASGMNSLTAAMSEGTGELAVELVDVNNQLSRVLLLMANALNGAASRQIFEDISDDVKPEDVEGRVSHCVNYGAVDADTNVGGVIGDMGIEYEFDLEGNLVETIGIEGIISNTYETKCVSSNNTNRGTVVGRKDDVGGITGLSEMGTIDSCESYGGVTSTDGSYVGGVAGKSNATIRNSYAMCDLNGKEYVGGIAGFGTRITGCGSLIGMGDVTACGGAIAGWADVTVEDAILDNIFVHDTLGAVDGISYEGKAVPVSYETLIERGGLPEQFQKLKLTFMADGVVVGELEFNYGGSVDKSQFPAVPEKDGFTGAWPEMNYDGLTFSTTVEAVYTPRQGALAAKTTRGDSPMSIVLVEGDFDNSAKITLNEYASDGPAVSGGKVLESWVLQLTGGEPGQEYTVRYLPPELSDRNHKVDVYVRSDGQWNKVSTSTSGSYLTFDCNADTVVFSAVEVKNSSTRTVILAVAGLTAVLGVGVALLTNRKKKPVPAAAGEGTDTSSEK